MQNEELVRRARDIGEHPERHEHDDEAFETCCTLPGDTEPDPTLVEMHQACDLWPTRLPVEIPVS